MDSANTSEYDAAPAALLIHTRVIHQIVESYTYNQQIHRRQGRWQPPGIPTTLDEPNKGAFQAARMLYSEPQYCFSKTRLDQPVLHQLIATLRRYGLTDTRIKGDEKVIMFLDFCAHKRTMSQLRLDYQHSFRSISQHIVRVSVYLTRLHLDLSAQKRQEALDNPAHILSNPRYAYFKGCLGAVDGTHIPIRPHNFDSSSWRNRKGWYSQNVLFACDFKLNILFV